MKISETRNQASKRKEFFYKKSQGFNLKKTLLMTSYQLLITATLTGCMGVYEGAFECPPGEGVGCKSISEVNTLVNQLSENSHPLSEAQSLSSGASSSVSSFEEKASTCKQACPANSEIKSPILESPIWYVPQSPFLLNSQEEEKVSHDSI